MAKGIPARCDPPESSPLLDGWSRPPTSSTTTTTAAPVENDDGIIIPASGQLCGDVTTTEPPNVQDAMSAVHCANTTQ